MKTSLCFTPVTAEDQRTWQLDALRKLRDDRLAAAEQARQDAWALYDCAVAALSDRCPLTGRDG